MIERYSRPDMKRVWSDENKFSKWLDVEIAVCSAWTEHGRIPRASLDKIKQAHCDLDRMQEILAETHHDMTAFLGSIADSVGPDARYIHLGLTSNDVMDTALSLQLVEASKILLDDLKELTTAVAVLAIKHKHTIAIGRTHGIHAEPTTFGLKLAIWFEELQRHRRRLEEAARVIAYGKISGAVGTYATVPPEIEEMTCAKLGLEPAPVSNQILQRDRHAQFVTTLALVGASLEKFATEIRLLQKTESREVEEPFQEGQTGSSAMPHKRNPELCERICGMARLLRGYAVTAMENVSLWHERDISHSSAERIILPDATLLLDYMLDIFTKVIRGLNVYPENMQNGLDITRGLVFSQRVMLALIDKGISRQEAYKFVQRNAMKSWSTGEKFLTLLEADEELMARIGKEELKAIFDYRFYLEHVDTIFRRLGLTEAQWKDCDTLKDARLAPGAI
ncbi:MAG: adenylosuccinate lyase [Dehalococcoidia bacterium]|nr:adenylosuccinate lyase [Dehalococcoidia bacterium]